MRNRVRGPVALVTLVFIASACGGSDGSSTSESSASSSSSTTTAKTAASAETIASAKQATLLADDYPEGWKIQTEAAARPSPTSTASTRTVDRTRRFPTERCRTAQSCSWARTRASSAPERWSSPTRQPRPCSIARLDSKGWETCELEALNDFQQQQKSKSKASIETREAPGLGTDQFASYALIRYADPATPDNLLATFELSVFQWGRVVVMVFVEQQFLEPGAQTTFDAQRREALVAQFARLDTATG